MSNILEINNLTINFATRDGSFKAVDDISFNIESNKTMALVGESGSGKSVTAMSILQLLPRPQASYSQASSIKFKGDEIIDASNDKLLNIRGNIVSMVFQEPMTSLNPYHRVGDQITESILLHTDSSKKEAIDEAIIGIEKGIDEGATISGVLKNSPIGIIVILVFALIASIFVKKNEPVSDRIN